jgi:hypothetical protein
VASGKGGAGRLPWWRLGQQPVEEGHGGGRGGRGILGLGFWMSSMAPNKVGGGLRLSWVGWGQVVFGISVGVNRVGEQDGEG